MSYTEEFLNKMISVGTLGYSAQKIINVLDVAYEKEAEFLSDFENPDSAIFKAYKKGLDKADYAIDMKLFEKARGGDLKALQKYEERKYYEQQRNG
jgi:hypothetical protein